MFRRWVEQFSVASGLSWGFTAAAGGSLGTVCLVLMEATLGGSRVSPQFLAISAAQWQYASHLGAVAGDPLLAGAGGLQVPAPIWGSIPIILCTGAGLILGVRSRQTTGIEAWFTGASTFLGYACGIVLVPGVLLTAAEMLSMSGESLGLALPAMPRLIVVAGIVYPATFGGFGGYLASRIN